MTTVEARRPDLFRRATEVLCSDRFDGLVEMVLSSPAPDTYEAHAIDGSVRFRRQRDGERWRYAVVSVQGRDPLGAQDATLFAPLAQEQANVRPARTANSYPVAYERIAQLFDHPCAPDLCVVHTAAHRPGHHRGEHGSLDVIQSRAPFIASGAGVARRGVVDEHCLIVDVAPTVLALLGAEPGTGVGPTGEVGEGYLLARQDGVVVHSVIDREARRPAHVVCVLFDGANPNVLYEMAAAGTLPHVARLIENGTAFAHGAIASLPTVTLANHTALMTGAHPGHHGVLHNAWYDRSLGQQVITESPATWQESMRWLFPGVETVHEAVHRNWPGAITASINEPADRGADYSTMELFRRGETELVAGQLQFPLPHTSPQCFEASEDYKWGSMVDAASVIQAAGIWSGEFLGVAYDPPTFCWVSLSVTDSAMHEGGPYSEIAAQSLVDSDARLGEIVSAIEARGLLEETAVILVADHGMEENDAERTGDWGDALREAGVEHRDEASGFLYLGERPDAG